MCECVIGSHWGTQYASLKFLRFINIARWTVRVSARIFSIPCRSPVCILSLYRILYVHYIFRRTFARSFCESRRNGNDNDNHSNNGFGRQRLVEWKVRTKKSESVSMAGLTDSVDLPERTVLLQAHYRNVCVCGSMVRSVLLVCGHKYIWQNCNMHWCIGARHECGK